MTSSQCRLLYLLAGGETVRSASHLLGLHEDTASADLSAAAQVLEARTLAQLVGRAVLAKIPQRAIARGFIPQSLISRSISRVAPRPSSIRLAMRASEENLRSRIRGGVA